MNKFCFWPLLAALMCAWLPRAAEARDRKPAGREVVIVINADLKAVDTTGHLLTSPRLMSGDFLRLCNKSGREIAVIVKDSKGRSGADRSHKVLGGASSVRLQGGECVARHVGTLPVGFGIEWTFQPLGAKHIIAGVGGGPDVINPPPPPNP